jgi:CBS domain-containing protein
MGRIGEILAKKGSQVHTLPGEATVYQAIAKMVEHNLGSLIIKDGDTVAGIFTERDFLRRVALEQRDPRTTKVRDVMTEKLLFLAPGHSVEECMAIMTQERIRHIPVLDCGKLAGLLSIGDVVKHVSDEREVEVKHLTNYVTGKYPG